MKHEDAVRIEKKVFCDDALRRVKTLEMPATTAFELGRLLEWMQEKLRNELDDQVFEDYLLEDEDDIWNEPPTPDTKTPDTKKDDKVMLEGEVALGEDDDFEDYEDKDDKN